MTKITLIKPPMLTKSKSFHLSHGVPPIGLAYIAGALKSQNFSYKILDAHGEKIHRFAHVEQDFIIHGLMPEEIVARIPKETEYILISFMFSCEKKLYYDICSRIRNLYPEKIIIVGGEHATAAYKEILDHGYADYCVLGEGDEVIVNLIKALEKNQCMKSVGGIAYVTDTGVIQHSRLKRIKNISEYKACWDQFPIENYMSIRTGMNTVNHRAFPISATRGCPYQCTFCSSPNMWGTSYFTRPPSDVVQEMKELHERYQVEHFDFTDLTAMVNRAWTLELCNLLIKENLPVTWQTGAGSRSETFTDEVLVALKKSKILKIIFAVEAGNQVTIDRIKKNLDVDKVMDRIKRAKRNGHHVKVQFIMGMVDQTLKECLVSAWYIIRCSLYGVEDISVFSFHPYPGSEMYDQVDRTHAESDEFYTYSDLYSKQCASNHLGPIQLWLLTTGMMIFCMALQYTIRPWRLWRLFKNIIITKKPSAQIEMAIFAKFFKDKKLYSHLVDDDFRFQQRKPAFYDVEKIPLKLAGN